MVTQRSSGGDVSAPVVIGGVAVALGLGWLFTRGNGVQGNGANGWAVQWGVDASVAVSVAQPITVSIRSIQGPVARINVFAISAPDNKTIPQTGAWAQVGSFDVTSKQPVVFQYPSAPYASGGVTLTALQVLDVSGKTLGSGRPDQPPFNNLLLQSTSLVVGTPGGPITQPGGGTGGTGPITQPVGGGSGSGTPPAPVYTADAVISLDTFAASGPWNVQPGQQITGNLKLNNHAQASGNFYVSLVWQNAVVGDGSSFIETTIAIAGASTVNIPFRVTVPGTTATYQCYLKVQVGDQVVIPNNYPFPGSSIYGLVVQAGTTSQPLPPITQPTQPVNPPTQPTVQPAVRLTGIGVTPGAGVQGSGPWIVQGGGGVTLAAGIGLQNTTSMPLTYDIHFLWTNSQLADGSSYAQGAITLQPGEQQIFIAQVNAPSRSGNYPLYLGVSDRTSGLVLISDTRPQDGAYSINVQPVVVQSQPPPQQPSQPVQTPSPQPPTVTEPGISWDMTPDAAFATVWVGVQQYRAGSPSPDAIQVWAAKGNDTNTPGPEGGWTLMNTVPGTGGNTQISVGPFLGSRYMHVALILVSQGRSVWAGTQQGGLFFDPNLHQFVALPTQFITT